MRFLSISLFALLSLGATPPRLRQSAVWPSPAPLRGGAPDPIRPGHFFTWGDALHSWHNGRARLLLRPANGFDPGGCAFDADRDGRTDLVLVRRAPDGNPLGDLVLLRAPRFSPEIIDTNVELHDCRAATLFQRSGFLILHRHAQVRFYHLEDKAWSAHELYSIYTASRQGGLALADVDADGHPDIYAGNYWLRSPTEFPLPWRIFAIHLHHQSEEAANFTYVASPDLLIGAQRERADTPIRLFSRPADPTQLWPETTLPAATLTHPRAALSFRDWAVFGHARGLFVFHPQSPEFAEFPAPPVLALWESRGVLYALSPGSVSAWRK